MLATLATDGVDGQKSSVVPGLQPEIAMVFFYLTPAIEDVGIIFHYQRGSKPWLFFGVSKNEVALYRWMASMENPSTNG